MKKSLKFWQVDAFTNQVFKGNPAAVFIYDEEMSDELMQQIAVEMNLSETAFVLLREGQNPLLRWFTPMMEIDLCGHATLASTHVYLTEVFPDQTEVTFDTKFVGPLHIQKSAGGYTMDFPSRPGDKVAIADIPSFILEALGGHTPVDAYKARDLMLVYDDPEIIRGMEADFNALAAYKDFICVTAPSDDPRYDFISRFYCADDGIAEDPVTGSAHCTLTPYWALRLDKTSMKAHQASPRGGDLSVVLDGDRVAISGEAVTVFRAEMTI